MGKVLKTVLIVIAVAAVIYFAPAAIAAIGLSGAVAGAVTTAIIGAALTLGSKAVTSIWRKPASMSNAMTDRLSLSVVPNAPRKIVFGRTVAGSDVRYYETYGSKKDRFAQVVALASHKITSVIGFYVNEELTWNGSLVAHTDGIASFTPVLHGTSSNGFALGSGAYWKSTSTFTGCAYLAIDYKLDSKAWPQGLPSKVVTIVEGCPVYDPRLDSTRGGSGPHRIDDQSTWEYHHGGLEIGRNPALSLLTYLIGYRVAGKLMWGMGIPATSINLDNFRLYANVCEERVSVAGGGTVQRYTADGIVTTADAHQSVINAITAAMGSSKLTDVGGTYKLVGGFDGTLGPIQHFDENDLVGGMGSPSPYSWIPAGPSSETYNIIEGQFAKPEDLYQLASWGRIESDNLADDIPRALTLDLGFVSRADGCQRIAKQFLAREAKTPGFFSATYGPKAFAVEVGSLITQTLPNQGWNRKLFTVIEQTEVHDLVFQMTLREESSEVYQWDKDETKAIPASIRPPGYDASLKVPVEGLTLSTVTYESSN